jgi:hypothetical protein
MADILNEILDELKVMNKILSMKIILDLNELDRRYINWLKTIFEES